MVVCSVVIVVRLTVASANQVNRLGLASEGHQMAFTVICKQHLHRNDSVPGMLSHKRLISNVIHDHYNVKWFPLYNNLLLKSSCARDSALLNVPFSC